MVSLIFIQSRLHSDSEIRRFAPSHPERRAHISAIRCVAPSHFRALSPSRAVGSPKTSRAPHPAPRKSPRVTQVSRFVQVSHSCKSFSFFANNTSRSLLLHTSIPNLQAPCSVHHHQSLINCVFVSTILLRSFPWSSTLQISSYSITSRPLRAQQ